MTGKEKIIQIFESSTEEEQETILTYCDQILSSQEASQSAPR